jgi:hypothetical protein
MNEKLKRVVGYLDQEVIEAISKIISIDVHGLEKTPVRKPIPGVYFLFQDDVIIYIGKSKDVLSRVQAHKNNQKEFDHYTYVECDEDLLTAYERIFINKYKPIQNADALTLKMKTIGLDK